VAASQPSSDGLPARAGNVDASVRPSLARLRGLARARRRAALFVLLAPALGVVAVDFLLRGRRILELPPRYYGSYAFAFAESTLFWGLLLYVASKRRGAARWIAAALFVTLAGVVVGGQIYFHRQYSTYLNLDATLFGTSLSESLFSQLKADGRNFLFSMGPPVVVGALLVLLGRRVVRPERTRTGLVATLLMPVVLVAAFFIPCSYRAVQGSTPDIIYLHAVGGLAKVLTGVEGNQQIRPGVRTPPPMPSVTAKPSIKRNVVFVLTESVRADVACSAPVAECKATPRLNAALPSRLPLTQMRATSSTTAIQLAVLWSGLPPHSSREDLHGYPLLYDYAHAAGLDSAYLSAHHMLFANSRLYVQDLPTTHQCGATDLEPLADIDLGAKDELLTARAKEALPTMKEPFLAVVHYSNTHVPYRIDPADAPFTPWAASKAPADNEAYRNYYKNAVYLQDKAIGDFVSWLRAQPMGDRTVIVFTSDHGEAFREHDQVGHTGAVLDEEIHVPFFVDAPSGTLTEGERHALAAARDVPVFHTAVAPTILDLLGLWDEPAFARWTASFVGSSLLRPLPAPKPEVLTNCTGIWGCTFKNWGVMLGTKKLAAREWDKTWRCYDLASDPLEKNDLGPAACGGLVGFADGVFGGPPVAGDP
jgi:glucan phosphoethanolaminetransferase (alkaline phosphatase superfamily)